MLNNECQVEENQHNVQKNHTTYFILVLHAERWMSMNEDCAQSGKRVDVAFFYFPLYADRGGQQGENLRTVQNQLIYLPYYVLVADRGCAVEENLYTGSEKRMPHPLVLHCMQDNGFLLIEILHIVPKCLPYFKNVYPKRWNNWMQRSMVSHEVLNREDVTSISMHCCRPSIKLFHADSVVERCQGSFPAFHL